MDITTANNMVKVSWTMYRTQADRLAHTECTLILTNAGGTQPGIEKQAEVRNKQGSCELMKGRRTVWTKNIVFNSDLFRSP